jgi:hypothetical protein
MRIDIPPARDREAGPVLSSGEASDLKAARRNQPRCYGVTTAQ